jgi:hypothetical protein
MLGAASALALLTGLITAPVALAAGPATPVDTVTVYSKPLRTAARELPVAIEHTAGYDRDLFILWIDADGDGCDTRKEILIAESKTTAVVGAGCNVLSGTWESYYDQETWTRPSDVDIDHVVALKEAWDSGAWNWNEDTRKRYANDLTNPRPLVAVTDNVNQSKSDKDFREWQPDFGLCHFAMDVVATKIRWSLKADQAEKNTIIAAADLCPNNLITVTIAQIGDQEPPPPPASAALSSIRFDPPGADVDFNQEWVVVKNTGTATANLAGWTVSDVAGASYSITATSLAPGATLTIHSGNGTAIAGQQYAGWGWTWNNTGDTATLKKPAGTVVDTCAYTASGSPTGTITC